MPGVLRAAATSLGPRLRPMRARPQAPGARGFRHEAFFYVDEDGYA